MENSKIQEKIQEIIEESIEIDYQYNGEDEIPVDVVNSSWAAEKIFNYLKENNLLSNECKS